MGEILNLNPLPATEVIRETDLGLGTTRTGT